MDETNFIGICEPKSELSEFISGDTSDLENDPLYDPDQNERRERNKQKRIRSKQNISGKCFTYFTKTNANLTKYCRKRRGLQLHHYF